MPQCMGIKANGQQCIRQDSGFINLNAAHLHYCIMHWDVYEGRVFARRNLTVVVAEQNHSAGTCHHWVSTGHRWCGERCTPGHLMCALHELRANARQARRDEREEEERRETARVNEMYDFLEEQQVTWRQAIDRLTGEEHNNIPARIKHRIVRRIFLRPFVRDPEFNEEWHFNLYWRWAIGGRVGPPPDLHQHPVLAAAQRQIGLVAIARDPQNVHTTAVSQQTNKGLEKLLEASKDDRAMRGPEWFASKWLIRAYGNWNVVQRTVNDMKHWYATASCKTANDYLYRRTLDGLYIVIQRVKDPESRMELYKRTFEECFESVGMCCEGHISRLCNVMVGFDDAFAPPVPFGEILQNKMAAIAAMEIDTEEKVKQATSFFNEFAVPEAERLAWIEAF